MILTVFSTASVLFAAELDPKRFGADFENAVDSFPAEQRENYELFKSRCTKCHSLVRPIDALTSGITPVTGDSFEAADIKTYVVRMMRKRGSGISPKDAKKLVSFLSYARARARESGGLRGTSTSTAGAR